MRGAVEPLSVSVEDIRAAAVRLHGKAVRTPLLEFADLNARTGGRIFIKPENLQVSGSFKFRGAHNRISQLSESERQAGVVAWSSGNHAQGIAVAARLAGVKAAIVMPSDAPKIKIERTRANGAEIVFYDRYTEDREAIGAKLAKERGAVLVPSYDDVNIIAGQGTAGLEIAEDLSVLGLVPDVVLCCCGGGGLIAGSALALRAFFGDVAVWAVEPEGFDDTARSLAVGARLENDPSAKTICDALMAPTPGHVTFEINRDVLAGGLAVSDDETRAAIRYAATELKLVGEPGGAVALAAALAGKLDLAGKTAVVVVTGGNIDPELLAEILVS